MGNAISEKHTFSSHSKMDELSAVKAVSIIKLFLIKIKVLFFNFLFLTHTRFYEQIKSSTFYQHTFSDWLLL